MTTRAAMVARGVHETGYVGWDRLRFWEWSIFDHFTWDAGAALIAGGMAALGVLIGFGVTSSQNRRERRARDYADAVRAVSDYMEGPYRVARCHNRDEERFAISTDISLIQGRIDASSVLLRLHAPSGVADAYESYVAAARLEAGKQMVAEWNKRPTKRHSDMNLQGRFDRAASNRAKEALLTAMKHDMDKRWWRFWRWFR